MGLKQEEFDRLPSITKKKILINMTGIKQSLSSNPNPQLLSDTTTRFTNVKSLVTFTRDNWHFLND